MGVLPDRLPGYMHRTMPRIAKPSTRFGTRYFRSKPGLATPQIVEAAHPASSKLLRMGANPFADTARLARARQARIPRRTGNFLYRHRQSRRHCFPAASAYEKDGTVTNTSGEIQLLRKARSHGHRTDFDLLRILSHQLERVGLGKAFHYKTRPLSRRNSQSRPGTTWKSRRCLTGSAEPTHVHVARNATPPMMFPPG